MTAMSTALVEAGAAGALAAATALSGRVFARASSAVRSRSLAASRR